MKTKKFKKYYSFMVRLHFADGVKCLEFRTRYEASFFVDHMMALWPTLRTEIFDIDPIAKNSKNNHSYIELD